MMTNLFKSLLAVSGVTVLFCSSCLKNNDNEPIIICDPVQPVAAFTIVDKTSGQDLFFSADPKYKEKEFYAFMAKDKKRVDTIKPRIAGEGTKRVFVLPLIFVKPKDTLIVKVADTPEDLFIYTIKPGTGPCGGNELDKVYLNGVETIKSEGKYVIKK